jgi:hypothetical protein
MRKTFQLRLPGRADQRVVEAVKNEVRKYIKRERRKALPAGVDFWDFACRVGPDEAGAMGRHVEEIAAAIDQLAGSGGTTAYIEVLAKAGHRTRKPGAAAMGADASPPAENAAGTLPVQTEGANLPP